MSGFRRAGLKVLVGSGAGAAVALGLTPVLSRLVSPSVFGSFMTVVALASVLVGVSTMRLEVAGQSEPDDGEARAALGLGLTLALVMGVVVTVLCAVAWALGRVPLVMLVVGPLISIASLQLVGTAWLARQRAYGSLAGATFLQNAGMTVAQTGLAVLSPTVGALIVGFCVGRLHWLTHVPKLVWRRAAMTRVWRRHRAYAITGGTAAGINSLAGQVPILLPAALYGDQAAGLFAMALRILMSPLALVSEAAAAAAVGEISQGLREGSRDQARRVLRRGLRDLAVVGAVPAVLAGALGIVAVPMLLGAEWDGAGPIVSALAIGAWAQFVVAPFSAVLTLAGHPKRMLLWDVCRLVAVTGAFFVPAVLGLGVVAAALGYSLAMVGLYAALAIASDRCLMDAG